MFSTKYPNNTRNVNGSVTVYNDDVILAVNTSTGAATINLNSIPSGYWNTPWKLYIYDASGNAATNNITIVAGNGQTINGAATLVLAVDGIRAVIEVSSNTSYIALRSDFGTSGTNGYNTIQDEGIALTQRQIINFTGEGVSAADTPIGGGKTTVTIPGYNNTVEDEGTPVTQRSTVNFVGAGVTVTDSGGKTVVTIPGGGISQAYQTIQDEGTPLTQRSTMNFVGNGVTVTDNGSITVITIPGGLISLTNAAMLALIAGGTVVAGQFYLITDANYANAGGVIVQGVTTSQITRSGNGLFYNADYQGVGNYTGVSGFGTTKGIWGPATVSVSANDVVIYNNRHYKNLTGSWGTAPSGDTTNWSILSYSNTNGYIIECDTVIYDVTSNNPVFRADKRNNEVDLYVNGLLSTDTFANFQWGRDAASYNKITGTSACSITNSHAIIKANVISSGTIQDTTDALEASSLSYNFVGSNGTLSSFYTRSPIENNYVTGASSNLSFAGLLDIGCECKDNIVTQGGNMSFASNVNGSSTVSKNTITGGSSSISASGACGGLTFTNNLISNAGIITITSTSTASITGCQVSDGITAALGALTSSTFTNQKVYSGFSNWQQNLDFSNGSIFSTVTLTIPAAYSYVGIFNCTNVTGSGVTYVVNGPTNHPFTLQPDSSSYFDFNPTALGSAAANCILRSYAQPTTPNTVTGATNGTENIVLKKLGSYNGIVQFNIWR